MSPQIPIVLFWCSIGFVIYVYVGYPLLVFGFSRVWPRRLQPQSNSDGAGFPTVTIVIPAHNEQLWIARKIENTLSIDYPRDRVQIIVSSDGSTDSTIDIAKRFATYGIELVHSPERSGKVAALNRAVPSCHGDILVFSDANALLQPDALRWLVPHFKDPLVGCVGGNRVCVLSDSSSTEGETLYWRYEAWIRYSESRFYSGLGAYGQLFAVRRELFPDISAISDDFPIPMAILVSTGAATVFEPRAKAKIPAALTLPQELERKIRSHVAFLCDFTKFGQGLNPWTSKIWWQFWSHHMFRLFVPWGMLLALMLSPWLWKAGAVYRVVVVAQVVFYLAALAGFLLLRLGIRWTLPYVCFYFVFANLAVAHAWVRWLRGGNYHTWQRTDRMLPVMGPRGNEGT